MKYWEEEADLGSLRAYCVPPTFPICPITQCESDCTVPILQMKGFPDSSVGKESASSAGDLGLTLGLGRSLEESMATHSSILAWRILMDREAWWAPVHRVPKSRTWLSDKEQHASCR